MRAGNYYCHSCRRTTHHIYVSVMNTHRLVCNEFGCGRIKVWEESEEEWLRRKLLKAGRK